MTVPTAKLEEPLVVIQAFVTVAMPVAGAYYNPAGYVESRHKHRAGYQCAEAMSRPLRYDGRYGRACLKQNE